MLGILVASLLLFVTEWLRMDVVALLVLAALAVTRTLTPAQALAGFSNPAVVTVWAMFILSAALTRTGVANIIGRHVLRLAGQGETRLIAVIMLAAGSLSAFMNNIGVAALLLPVVMDVARKTGRPPSRLLMPLAFGSLLGGLTTLIGTPPNLLASDALRQHGLAPFRLFDFSPLGLPVVAVGVLFVALLGRRWLPIRDPEKESSASDSSHLRTQYALHERTFAMRLPPGSVLAGKSLEDSRFGSALGLNIFGIVRAGRTELAPDGHTLLRAGDRLLVEGQRDRLDELRGWRELVIEENSSGLERVVSEEIGIVEVDLPARSPLVGQTLLQADLRSRFHVNVLAVRRDSTLHSTKLHSLRLKSGDRMLMQGKRPDLETLSGCDDFEHFRPRSRDDLASEYRMHEWIFAVRVPVDSVLVGETLRDSRLGDVLDMQVLAIERGDDVLLMPDAAEPIAAEDRLVVQGQRADLEVFRGLQQLEIESDLGPDLAPMESEDIGLVEAALSPRSTLADKTLRQLDFRQKFGLQVLAIWRGGRAYRSNLRDMPLRFGDALLLLGRWEHFKVLGRDPDFLVLTQAAQESPRTRKAAVASLVMASVMVPVLFGWLPISIASVAGVSSMVILGCISMEEAYRAIEWKSVFLIAGMLPLGTALEQTGGAAYLADRLLAGVGSMGSWGVLASLYLVTALATSIIPTAALVVLMAPIVMKSAADTGMSPHALMMAVAMAASASFTSPISHPANVLVMGPGGYRFVDYVKLGVPLTLVILVAVLLLLPVFWPLYP